jgi:organic hydroperoxide reductase OsmC/OhrA
MAHYTATIEWHRTDADNFAKGRYSRAHDWRFDGGATVRASASPHVVPAPLSDPAGVDPEEAFVASLSSCHMLWFLHIASRAGFVVDAYEDRAVGHMEKTPEGRWAITRVVLRPHVRFAGEAPDAARLAEFHEKSHQECFIANSVRSTVTVESAP